MVRGSGSYSVSRVSMTGGREVATYVNEVDLLMLIVYD